LTASRPRLWAVAVCATCLLATAGTALGAPRGFFGVTPQAGLGAADFEAMGATGIATLRFELAWSAIDPSPTSGDRDWSHSDELVAGAARQGIEPLPFVFSTPGWVAALDGHRCGAPCGTLAPRGAAALAAWREFLAAAVDRYGPEGTFWASHPELPQRPVRTWQLWNEQNSPTYFAPQPDVGVYARLVRSGHKAIESADPGAEVVLGGMFGAPLGGRKPVISAPDFLAALYRRPGIEAAFDGVASHPYGGRMAKVKAQVERLRAASVAAGDARAALWVTELGWASAGPPGPLNRGPLGQARRLTQAFKYFLKKRRVLNIRTVNWYSWRDNPDPGAGLCAWCSYSGLMTADLSEKPSQKALKRFTSGN
jgi:hypothetical protein